MHQQQKSGFRYYPTVCETNCSTVDKLKDGVVDEYALDIQDQTL